MPMGLTCWNSKSGRHQQHVGSHVLHQLSVELRKAQIVTNGDTKSPCSGRNVDESTKRQSHRTLITSS